MKTPAILLAIVALAASPLDVLAQGGSLTPPLGVPAPTMKTLDQVEARIPLVEGSPGISFGVSGTIIISQKGSYYLTRNLNIIVNSINGIEIDSNDVTLDLNGYCLTHSIGIGGNAVNVNGSNVTVRNGTIRGGTTVSGSTFSLAGWTHGVYAGNNYPNVVVENVSVFGVRERGLYLSYEGSRIESCSTHTTGGIGMYASSISFSSARKAGLTAISSSSYPDNGSISDCFGESVGTNGITGIDSPVINSVGIGVSGFGISAEVVNNCVGTSTSATGITASVVTNSIGTSINATGIFASSGTVSFSRGSGSPTAINAAIAIGCTAGSGTITSAQKHLGTP